MCLHLGPFNSLTLRIQTLPKGEFIDVVFMSSLSGRQCSVWGEPPFMSDSSWRPGTELPAKKVYGGAFWPAVE